MVAELPVSKGPLLKNSNFMAVTVFKTVKQSWVELRFFSLKIVKPKLVGSHLNLRLLHCLQFATNSI